MGNQQLTDDLLALERRGWDALADGRARAFYANMLAADAVMVLPVGVMDREASITAMASAPPWATYHLDDATAVSLAPETAVLVYRATAQRESQPPYGAYITSTYRREDGTWRLVMHQQSPVAG